jgi:hypothetical protein
MEVVVLRFKVFPNIFVDFILFVYIQVVSSEYKTYNSMYQLLDDVTRFMSIESSLH